MSSPELSPNLIGLIALWTGDRIALHTLQHYMSPEIYQAALMTFRRTLIYGQIQSGKTAEIFKIALDPKYRTYTKIIVVQNSLLVLLQYMQRFRDAGLIDRVYTVGDKRKKAQQKDKDILLLLNNRHRYGKFKDQHKNNSQKFVLILDEADQCATHPLTTDPLAMHIYYVTATPNRILTQPEFFHYIHRIEQPEEYKGIDAVHIQYSPHKDPTTHVANFADPHQYEQHGMMLVTTLTKVRHMRHAAQTWSENHPAIPMVLVNAKKSVFLAGIETKLGKKPIQKIIDAHSHFPKIVFLANRLANRGLSYVSSDYTRHLTHQVSNFRNVTITNAMQKMRLLGKYNDQIPLTLILPGNNQKIADKMQTYDVIDTTLDLTFDAYDLI
jgi:hypothetical protein